MKKINGVYCVGARADAAARRRRVPARRIDRQLPLPNHLDKVE